jgi:hypothetical protein
MLSHELAAILLASPNLPIATHANNHTYMSSVDAVSHGTLKVGLLHTYGGNHIVVGDISKRDINGANWYITDMIHGDAP